MDKINHCHNHNRFIAIDSEELSALELIHKTLDKNNEIVDKINEFNVSKTDVTITNAILEDTKKLWLQKTDVLGDHKGTWQGLSKPTLSEEGMRATVEKLQKDCVNITNDIVNISTPTSFPQGTKPSKVNPLGNGYKIGYKSEENKLKIVQPTNKGYVCYTLAEGMGASGVGDYGVNHQLLRLIKAEVVQSAYLYYDISTPNVGSWSGTQYESGINNSVEQLINYTSGFDTLTTFSNKGVANGVGCYKLLYGNSVSFDIPVSLQNEFTLAFLGSPTGSKGTIYVNDMKVAEFNSKACSISSSNGVGYVKFPVPTKSTTDTTFTIKIANEDTTGYCFPIAFNVVQLKDYNKEMVTNFKCYGTNKSWISHSGASDYALYDYVNKKWFGSYHGGEVSKVQQITWGMKPVIENDYLKTKTTLANITVGDWIVSDDIDIYQVTDLADSKAEMVSKFSFGENGTFDMIFGYNGTVDLSTFYTALTCTDVGFNYVFYPTYKNLGTTPSGDDILLPMCEGLVSQVNSSSALQLDIRFTKWNNAYNQQQCKISDVQAYRKFYYGIVYGNSNHRVITNANFSKSLDFIVR